MRTYHAGKSQTQVSNGLVCLIARFDTDAEVFTVYSPKAARYLARILIESADEADAWEPPDTEELQREAADDTLDDMGVARLEEEAPKRRRGRKPEAEKEKA